MLTWVNRALLALGVLDWAVLDRAVFGAYDAAAMLAALVGR